MTELSKRLGQLVLDDHITAKEAVDHCLGAISRVDGELQSFVALRAEAALEEAQKLDALYVDSGRKVGPLQGIPFAVKDVFETRDLPTTYFSKMYQQYQPARDAAVVSMLRNAGAILLGKVSTVEFAGMGEEPPTRNPLDLARTPGGSSSGSGAAVGGGLVPLAIGSQTGGSTIRPAAYCGVVGLKPTWGMVSCEGMKPFAPSLDTVGFILEHTALLLPLVTALRFPIATPSAANPLRIGIYKTPYAERASPETIAAVDYAAGRLASAGHEVMSVTDPAGGCDVNAYQDVVMWGEGHRAILADYWDMPHLASAGVEAAALNSRAISLDQLTRARDSLAGLRPQFDAALAGFDAWLCPAVPDVAPLRSEGNGEAVFNRLFTALHLPCITLPVRKRAIDGLPLAVQLIGGRHQDAHVIRAAEVVSALCPLR